MELSQHENTEQDKLVWAAQALRNRIRLQIYQILSNKNSCSFNELIRELDITQPKLAYHLQTLLKYNIITNFYDKREGVKDHSFYELSSFGRELFSGIASPGQSISDPEPVPEPEGITQNSVNFRTIRQVKYKSYANSPVKRTTKTIKPLGDKDRKYFDSLLDCNIITKSATSAGAKKLDLPSFNKYYQSYKRSFKSKQNIEPKS